MDKHFNELAWFCVRTQPKNEHIAASHLRLLDGVEVYAPRLRFRKLTQRGPVWFTEALFPGYIFSRFVPMDMHKQVTYARGVTAIVRFGEKLAMIAEETIADLRQHIGDNECKVLDQGIREGDTVTITGGTFKGLSTVVTQLLPARERVRVLIEFLGQCREVEVDKSNILSTHSHLLST